MLETLFATTASAALLVLSALTAVAAIPFRLTGRKSFIAEPAVAKLMPFHGRFFSAGLLPFYTVQIMPTGRQSLPNRQLLPVCLCRARSAHQKKPSEITASDVARRLLRHWRIILVEVSCELRRHPESLPHRRFKHRRAATRTRRTTRRLSRSC